MWVTLVNNWNGKKMVGYGFDEIFLIYQQDQWIRRRLLAIFYDPKSDNNYQNLKLINNIQEGTDTDICDGLFWRGGDKVWSEDVWCRARLLLRCRMSIDFCPEPSSLPQQQQPGASGETKGIPPETNKEPEAELALHHSRAVTAPCQVARLRDARAGG